MQHHGWVGDFKLQDLKETVSDISPEDSQMHDWIVRAARSKKFSIVREGGLAHLEAKINAGGFTTDIRLPPETDLEDAGDDMKPRNYDLAWRMLQQHQQQHQELVNRETEAHESQAKIKELQEHVQQLESRLSNVQLALRQAQARTPSKSQNYTASLSSLDATSPSQTLQASQGTQGGHKKARSAQTQQLPTQNVATQDANAAADTLTTSISSMGAAAQFGNEQAGSQSGYAYGVADQVTASHPSKPPGEEGAESEVGTRTAPRVGQARVVARGRGRGRGRQATKIGE
ncbi:hypothetical protein ABBQ38_008993 [Trebouxia sp. C0009 RCD-2024]